MISRGYFIGEIVDGLSDIASQVSTRGKLGLFDLNKVLEDFFKTALNHLYSLSLENLNKDKSNYPGLDLGDKSEGWAFQITAENTSKKINKTLEKLTDEQINDFPKIKMLIIGKKQTSYTGLDKKQCNRTGFNQDAIWDIDTLCKQCMDLPLNVLQTLYEHIRSELARVKIELEVPDQDGNYPTNIADFIEAVPKPKLTNCKKFYKHLEDDGIAESLKDTQHDFALLSGCLAQLPRITRDFLAVMIERRETERRTGVSWDGMEINHDKLERISKYPDTEGELRLLMGYNFIYCDEPESNAESSFWRISCPKTSDYFLDSVVDYAEKNNIPLTRPIVNLDFSDF